MSEGTLEEFKALRSEIEHRSTNQQAIVALELTALTAIAALANEGEEPRFMLVLVPLSFFLGLAWLDHHEQIRSMGLYIRRRIEPVVPGMGWEQWCRGDGELPVWEHYLRFWLPTVALFGGTAVGAVVAAWLLAPEREVWLFVMAGLLALTTCGVVGWRTRYRKDPPVDVP